ncbi:MAG: replicative DNA helicase [Sedimentisphaerales bacterium]|nr:replicative DNA helicase [Sedimentisphaerales bacterium]MBN2843081.1 replicative DNA helicase [Sedimentisphaerales bacterium]
MQNQKKSQKPQSLKETNKANMLSHPAVEHRIPPQDVEAEQAALASMLLNKEAVGEILPLLNRDCFYRQDHAEIFDAILALYESNKPVDLITLKDELIRRNKLEAVGNIDYLITISEAVPSAVNGLFYAKIVHDKAMLRNLIIAANEINEEAFAGNYDTAEILEDAERKIFEVTQKKVTRQALGMKQIMSDVFTSLESRDGRLVTGLPTGYNVLDSMTCGLQPGEMIIIAARPSMGKTALGLNIAEHIAADNNIPVLVFSLEMSAQMLAERMLAGRAHVDSQKLRRGMLNDKEHEMLSVTAGELAMAPLYVDDSSTLTPLELRAKARRMKMQYDIQLIVIDYLQLMSAPGAEGRTQEVGMISRHIKAVARELEIPVIAMAQLNRGPEGRDGHKPRMSDLRESGNIEQDADVVMLLHREGYYKRKTAQDEAIAGGNFDGSIGEEIDDTLAEIIIEKQRNGPTGAVELTWLKQWTRFVDKAMAPEY